MKMNQYARGERRCQTKANLRIALWCISALVIGLAIPATAFCQTAQTATWAGGTNNWFTGTSRWYCPPGPTRCGPPNNSISYTWTARIGTSAGGNGTVTLNGGASLTTIDNLVLGAGATGTLNAQPLDYMPGSNSLTVNNTLVVGQSSTGTLNFLSNGDCDEYAPPTCGGGTGSGTAVGNTLTSGTAIIGDQSTGNGAVYLEGNGEQWTNTGNLTVGNQGTGFVLASGGAIVSDTNGYVGGAANSSGTVTITNPGSEWTNSGSVYIGISGSATLNVSDGGLVTSGGTIRIGPNAIANAGSGGLEGDVVVANTGNLESGTSVIHVFGSYVQDPGGILTLDVDNTGLGNYGILDVHGPALLASGSIIDIDFIDNFTPSVGDTFYFIAATAGIYGAGPTFDLTGLGPDEGYSTALVDGGDVLEVTITAVPEPAIWSLLVTALIALGVFAGGRKRPAVSDLAI